MSMTGWVYVTDVLQADRRGWRGKYFAFLKGFYYIKLDTSTGFSQTQKGK